ncbi:uncharacterized protein LOC110204287 [Phascolarctos cinereus]
MRAWFSLQLSSWQQLLGPRAAFPSPPLTPPEPQLGSQTAFLFGRVGVGREVSCSLWVPFLSRPVGGDEGEGERRKTPPSLRVLRRKQAPRRSPGVSRPARASLPPLPALPTPPRGRRVPLLPDLVVVAVVVVEASGRKPASARPAVRPSGRSSSLAALSHHLSPGYRPDLAKGNVCLRLTLTILPMPDNRESFLLLVLLLPETDIDHDLDDYLQP